MSGFEPLKREAIPLLLGVAGGTGSGKTMSALLLARGLAGGKPFAGIDTENGRMSHYAESFPDCRAKQISAPFRPSKYADAIEEAVAYLKAQGIPPADRVVVVDSASHEWYGDGGCLDWQEEIMDGKESRRLMSWIDPKKAHKRFVTRLLQLNAHVILCFRAEPKVEMIDDPDKPGKKKFIEKRSLTGLDGWIPIAEKNLPYELTASFLLMADRPGFPKPIKLQEQHKTMVPLDKPLSEETGKQLAAWAAGGAASVSPVLASKEDRDRIVAAAKAAGLTSEQGAAAVSAATGQPKLAAVPASKVDAVIAEIESAGVAA